MEVLRLRRPALQDASRIYELAVNLPELDRYSPYLYLVLCDRFPAASVIAERAGELEGFVTGLVTPDRPDTLFVWQVGVAPRARGKGVGLAMLRGLFQRPENGAFRFLDATVSPNNRASRRLFEGFARDMSCPLRLLEGYPASLFPAAHESEPLLRIGPFERSAS